MQRMILACSVKTRTVSEYRGETLAHRRGRMGAGSSASSFERLFQDVQLLIELGVFLPLAPHFAHGMQHRRVVAAPE